MQLTGIRCFFKIYSVVFIEITECLRSFANTAYGNISTAGPYQSIKR